MKKINLTPLLCFFTFIFTATSYSQNNNSTINSAPVKKQQINVKWYQPELDTAAKDTRTKVILSGKTIPGALISISRKVIPLFTFDNKVKYIARDKITTENSISSKANKDGFFSLKLELPFAVIQLPLSIQHSRLGKQKRNFQLTLTVNRQDAKIRNEGILGKSPFLRPHYRFWLGLGFNYLRYQQTTDAPLNSDIVFQTLKGPSLFAKAAVWINDNWDFSFVAKSSPGSTVSSDTIQVTSGAYNWNIFIAEGSHFPTKWKYRPFKKWDAEVGYRFGIQHHIVPFLARTGVTPSETEVKTNTIEMVTVGIQTNLYPSLRWSLEAFLRFQQPLSSGDSFNISPKVAFDGSIGGRFRVNNNWNIGFFWYGQFQIYGFTHTDALFNSELSGSQSLFFSNLELRGGYQF